MFKLISAALLGLSSASKFKVIHPSSLRESFSELDMHGNPEKGIVRSQLGNFGHFDQWTSLKGRLHYPQTNADGCRPFKSSDFNQDHLDQGKRARHGMLIMVDRGICHFVLKAKHVQDFGGTLMIVIDYKENVDVKKLHMGDDGKGGEIKIPSFIIGYQDGKTLELYILNEDRTKSMIIVQADIDMTKLSAEMVALDFWYSDIYEIVLNGANEFINNYAQMSEIFEQHVNFVPRSMVYKIGKNATPEQKKKCQSEGLYCPIMTEHDIEEKFGFLTFDKPLTPDDLIEEKMRELCVHKALFPTHKSAWFTYMHNLIDECVTSDINIGKNKVEGYQKLNKVTEQCHNKVLKEFHYQEENKNIKMDYQMYKICYAENKRLLNPDYNSKNPSIKSMFDKDMAVMELIGHSVHPSVSINGITYRGEYDQPNSLFKAICKSIVNKPEICQKVSFKTILSQDDEDTIITYDDSNPLHKKVADEQYELYDSKLAGMDKRARMAEIILGLVIICIINCMLILFCKLRNKKKSTRMMEIQVNEQVSNYFALAGQEDTQRNSNEDQN